MRKKCCSGWELAVREQTLRICPLGIDHAERTFYNLLEFSTAYTPCAKVQIAHWVLLPLCLRTPRAYGFAAVRRNVANALVNFVLCCWSMRYSLAVASKAFPRCWRVSTL